MKMIISLLLSCCLFSLTAAKYDPTWKSLDTRPLPQWYDDAKIGIFIHWGVYAVPSMEEWFWLNWKEKTFTSHVEYMNKNYPPDFTYQEFAKDFTAEFYDPVKWAKLFEKAGAKYVVLTSKHHEGYTLWPSKYSFSWNSVDVGPHRNLLGELAEAVRQNTSLHFGVYYSLLEWYNPLYMSDKCSNFTENKYFLAKVKPELHELIENYRPEILWTDGEWEAEHTYWEATKFISWLYNESPVNETVVVNDRWGAGLLCKQGDFYTCVDRYNPGVIQKHKWENAMTIDKDSWGFRRNANLSSYLTSSELISTVVTTVSCGGNILINVGPTKDGIITPIYEERLLDLGNWLSINGEAIYCTKPWTVQNDTNTDNNVWYTAKDKAVYAITLKWPKDNILKLDSMTDYVSEGSRIYFLETLEKLKFSTTSGTVAVRFPDKAKIKGDYAWTLKIVNEEMTCTRNIL